MGLHVDNRLESGVERLLYTIIGAALEVHKELGPGYLEKVYENALAIELGLKGIDFEIQVPVSVMYKGEKVQGQVLDMIVGKRVILEFKTVDHLTGVHEAQLLSYLKSTGMPAGLLINFKEPLLKNGIKRFVNTKINC